MAPIIIISFPASVIGAVCGIGGGIIGVSEQFQPPGCSLPPIESAGQFLENRRRKWLNIKR
jgi:hypothetical protein